MPHGLQVFSLQGDFLLASSHFQNEYGAATTAHAVLFDTSFASVPFKLLRLSHGDILEIWTYSYFIRSLFKYASR